MEVTILQLPKLLVILIELPKLSFFGRNGTMNKIKRIGRLITKSEGGETHRCYIPQPLPPNPPIQPEKFYKLLDKANVSLGELNGIRTNLPNASLFLHMFTRKEAVLSSQIEGTQSSLSDFLLFENKEENLKTNDDDIEVANYISAMNYGLKRIEKLPLSRRLLCEIHEKLLSSGRGMEKCPGEIRTSQNWIGGTRPGNAIFVPPSPEHIANCFGDFEKFLHDEKVLLPTLIKVAMAHVQFETIHPFLDGNGRLGRLLITFMLCISDLLKEPLLYLSLYFKHHREKYYTLLQNVRKTGDWESWIEFFLTGVYETSHQAFNTAQKIVSLFENDEEKIKKLNKDTAGVLKTYNSLKKHPISNTRKIVQSSQSSLQTVLRSLRSLEEAGLVKELTGKHNNKIFIYKNYINIINQGTELK